MSGGLIHTDRVIVVEGRYDVSRLSGITDADILMTDGFAVYSDKEKQQLLRRLAEKRGLLILTDSDAAGFQIRTFITNIAGESHVCQAYIPACPGKEPRKQEPGKEGLLGVEGINDTVLRGVLENALRQDTPTENTTARRTVTYTDLYEWGLSGREGSSERKAAFLRGLGLPPRLSKKELVAVLNSLYTFEELEHRLAQTDIPESGAETT